jgi:leucyl/phenylalanyl-tRNA--protein transferase
MAIFLDPEFADEMGLVAVGGDLEPQRLVEAYCSGIFPWFDEGGPVLWWSPDPRAILEIDGLHVSRRLARTLRSGKFRCTINHAFDQVIRGCADRTEGTWLVPDMIAAYERLFRLGLAHSVEAWCGDELAGGIYGVAIRGLFAAESMFTRRTDGSKAALVFLADHLRRRGFQLFDIQMITQHTLRLGAVEIPRKEYLERLKRALECDVAFIGGFKTGTGPLEFKGPVPVLKPPFIDKKDPS